MKKSPNLIRGIIFGGQYEAQDKVVSIIGMDDCYLFVFPSDGAAIK